MSDTRTLAECVLQFRHSEHESISPNQCSSVQQITENNGVLNRAIIPFVNSSANMSEACYHAACLHTEAEVCSQTMIVAFHEKLEQWMVHT